jgi:hypothetical protein
MLQLLTDSEAEFSDEIQTKASRDFLLAIHSHLYSFVLRFTFLQIHATSYSFYVQLLYNVKEKGGKLDRKPYLLPYGLRNPYRTLKIMPRNRCADPDPVSDPSFNKQK